MSRGLNFRVDNGTEHRHQISMVRGRGAGGGVIIVSKLALIDFKIFILTRVALVSFGQLDHGVIVLLCLYNSRPPFSYDTPSCVGGDCHFQLILVVIIWVMQVRIQCRVTVARGSHICVNVESILLLF